MNFMCGRRLVSIGLCVAVCWSVTYADNASPTQVGHLNLVFVASDANDVHKFYGEVLGLKRIADINLPGESVMIRYLGGESEIKFIVGGSKVPKREGGTQAARGIRLLAILLPLSDQDDLLSRWKAAGNEPPKFTEGQSPAGYSYRYTMLFDGDGNQVEIVFLGEGAPENKFKQIQIGLNVSDVPSMDKFLTDVLGLLPEVTEGEIHRFGMGVSQVKYWQGRPELPALTGNPMGKLGMNLVQFLVPDVDAVRTSVLAKGGKIHTEPFPLGNLATIMFVEGPDGIIFEFAGPLLDRFKK